MFVAIMIPMDKAAMADGSLWPKSWNDDGGGVYGVEFPELDGGIVRFPAEAAAKAQEDIDGFLAIGHERMFIETRSEAVVERTREMVRTRKDIRVAVYLVRGNEEERIDILPDGSARRSLREVWGHRAPDPCVDYVGNQFPDMVSAERGPFTQTLTGGHWYSFTPRPEDVLVADFRALTRINRFGGHTTVDCYSDAEHAVRCAWVLQSLGCSALVCFGGLHHDSHEFAPPGDQLGPFMRATKNEAACALLGLTPAAFAGILEVMRRATVAVREALGLLDVFADAESARLIKHADMVLLATERRDLMAPSSVDWGRLPEPLPNRIVPWTPDEAWRIFRETHESLCAAMGRP